MGGYRSCQPAKAQNMVRFALFIFLMLVICREDTLAQGGGGTSTYVVQPGDALPAIAARFGVDLTTLQQLNALQDPRQVYVGQSLQLPGADTSTRSAYPVAFGDDLGSLARRAGRTWEAVAEANRLVNPGTLLVGQTVYLPHLVQASVVTAATSMDTRLAVAVRYNVAYWPTLRLNPQPLYAGAAILVPGKIASPALPYPLKSLSMTSQPVTRGQTAILAIETVAPASCVVIYLDVTEPCYVQSDTRLLALVGLQPLLEPGVYDVELRMQTQDGATASVVVPVHVAPGRYDFERIDLPPDRQSLLDPALSGQERAKIAALRTLRSPDRYWEFPFRYPVQASVTSYYGSRRSYGYGFGSYHGGTDFQAERGMPVYAPASGVVVLAERLVIRGNAILIDHGWGVVSGYWHLSRIDVAVGQQVVQGEQLGLIGNTGLSTGPHLHWELWVNGVSVSALQWVNGFDADFVPAR